MVFNGRTLSLIRQSGDANHAPSEASSLPSIKSGRRKHSFYGIIEQWIIHKARRPVMKKSILSLLCILAFALPFVAATPCFADTGETTIDQITYRYDTETGEAAVSDADESISLSAFFC